MPTPKGFPYPAATAPVASGAADIQALATAVDTYLAVPAIVLLAQATSAGLPFNRAFTLPRAIAAGMIMVWGTVYASGTVGNVTIEVGIDNVYLATRDEPVAEPRDDDADPRTVTRPGAQLWGYLEGAAHRIPLVPAAFSVTALAAGAHTFNFRGSPNAVGDAGDFMTAVLFGF